MGGKCGNMTSEGAMSDIEAYEGGDILRSHHDESTRQLAYELWAYVCGRSVREVAAELRRTRQEPNPLYPEGECHPDDEDCIEERKAIPRYVTVPEHPDLDGRPIELSERTLRDWVTRYGWLDRVQRDVAALGPSIHQEQITELILLSVDGRKFLRNLFRQAQVAPATIEPTYGRALGPMVNAAMGALDRAGYSHLGRIEERVHQIDDPTIRELLAGVEAMTDEELVQADAALVDQELRKRAQRETKR